MQFSPPAWLLYVPSRQRVQAPLLLAVPSAHWLQVLMPLLLNRPLGHARQLRLPLALA